MHLLFVCKSLPYSFKGGIQTHVWELTKYLIGRGCRITILTGGSLRRGSYTETHQGRELIFLPYLPGRRLPFLQKTTEDVSFNATAFVWLRRHGAAYDCIHVQGRSGCFYAAHARRSPAPPVLTTFHRLLSIEYEYDGQATGPVDGFLHRRLMGFAERRAARHSDQVIAVSEEMHRELLGCTTEALAPVQILPNGVSRDFGEPVAVSDPRQLIFVGRLERIKGVYSLLEAMQKVDERICLKIVGDGPERRGLERIIRHDVSLRRRVHLLGDQDAESVRDLIQRSHALVLPSFHESQGIVLIEAGICGRPVIGASAPGIDEVVVHGETGLLYPPGDAHCLAVVIDHLFANPDVARRLGHNGRLRAEAVYDWEHIAADTHELYGKLIGVEADRLLPPQASPCRGSQTRPAAQIGAAAQKGAAAQIDREAIAPKVSVVTVNYRQAEVTCDLLDDLRACTYPNLEVVLVDNGSLRDERARWQYHYPGVVHVRSEENLGFAGGTNLGIRHAGGELILLLNNDTYVTPDFLQPMVEVLRRHPSVGTVSPKILFAEPAGTIQYAGSFISQPVLGRGTQIGHLELDRGQYDDTRLTDLPHGACMLVRREVFERVGMLPEFYFMYFEELDFAVAARRAGFETMYCGATSIRHRQSVSLGVGSPRKTYYLHRNRLVFYRRMLSGASYYVFLLYYLVVALPFSALRFLRQRRTDHVRALGEALDWNARRAVSRKRAPLGLPHLSPREV